jgi:hypothetical protein
MQASGVGRMYYVSGENGRRLTDLPVPWYDPAREVARPAPSREPKAPGGHGPGAVWWGSRCLALDLCRNRAANGWTLGTSDRGCGGLARSSLAPVASRSRPACNLPPQAVAAGRRPASCTPAGGPMSQNGDSRPPTWTPPLRDTPRFLPCGWQRAAAAACTTLSPRLAGGRLPLGMRQQQRQCCPPQLPPAAASRRQPPWRSRRAIRAPFVLNSG